MSTSNNNSEPLRKSLVVITWKPEAQAAPLVLALRLVPARGAFWQTVTGHVDVGESFAEAALREAQEETGLAFERHPQHLGLEYEFTGKENRPVREQAFLLPIVGGDAPPTPTLDGKEHDAFEWLSPEEAAKRVKFPGNRSAIERATGAPLLFLAKSGVFFQEGEAITHARTAELLHRSLVRGQTGFLVRLGQEEVDVVVEDLPRFVTSYDRASGEIVLAHGARESLDPASLKVREDHSMSCRTQEGLEARLLSPAYYELTKDVKESAGEYFLHFRGRDYRLSVAP